MFLSSLDRELHSHIVRKCKKKICFVYVPLFTQSCVIVMLVMNPERAMNAPGRTFFVYGWFSSNTVAKMAYFVIDYWMCSRVLHIR